MRKMAVLWFVGMCGCGEVKGPAVAVADAGVAVDAAAAADATPDDADLTGVLGVVTQVRYAGALPVGAAQGGVDVVSMRPNATVADVGQTDASGQASLKIYPGGSITAIYHHAADPGTDLVTYFGAQPGDVLTFGQRFAPAATSPVGAMTFSYPAMSGVGFYQVFGPCGSETAPVGTLAITLTELEACHHDPMDVVYLALDSGGRVMGFNYLSVAFQAGTSRAIGAWTTPKTAMVNMTGLPPEVQGVNAVLTNVGNVEQRMFGFFVNGQATGGAYSNTFPWAPTDLRTEAHLSMSRSGNFEPMHLIDALQAATTTWTVAAPALPPWLQLFGASTADRTASLHLVGDGPYDAAVLQISWTHVAGSASAGSTWTFILPPGLTAFAFPRLPPPFAAGLPQPEDAYEVQAHVIEIPAIPSYDALRAIPERSLLCPGSLVPDCAVRSGELARVVFE